MQELDKLPWFGSMKGVASLVADAMKEDGTHSLSDVAVALQAAHLLVWQHEVEHGEICSLELIKVYLICQVLLVLVSHLSTLKVRWSSDPRPPHC